MAEEEKDRAAAPTDDRLSFATVQSTYKIIAALLEQVDAASSLIAAMASALGEDATRRITETVAWANYLQGRRTLETLRPELERFAATATKIANQESGIRNQESEKTDS